MTKQYSGRRFTAGFVVVTAVLLTVSVMINSRVERLTAELNTLRQMWPRVSESISPALAKADSNIAGDRAERAQKFRKLYGDFRRSVLYDDQSRLLGATVAAAEAAGTSVEISLPAQADWPAFVAADRRFERSLNDPVGRLTRNLLFLEYPPRVYPVLEHLAGGERREPEISSPEAGS